MIDVTNSPEQYHRWLDDIHARLQREGLVSAGRRASEALAHGFEDAFILSLAGAAAFEDDDFAKAAQFLRRARELAPNDANVANSLGICMASLGEHEAAIEAYRSAIELDPALAPAFYNLGALLEARSELVPAREAYQRAVTLDRDYAEPLAGLAWLDAQSGNAADARAWGLRALAISPTNTIARMAMASTALQQGDLNTAATFLNLLRQGLPLTPLNSAIVAGMVGDCHDARGRPTEAFAAYEAGNATLRSLYEPSFGAVAREPVLTGIARLERFFARTSSKDWAKAPAVASRSNAPARHVFLVGFPRSGTTLLENVLAGHPDIVTLEEKDCVERVAEPYLASDEGLKRLTALNERAAENDRDRYWARVAELGVETSGRIFIDKMPLSSVQLPVIAKLFPAARILFCLRDPRDVVLSCFRRRFEMNPAMFQLLTLDGAATYYDGVMRLVALYRSKLALHQHTVHYEDVVDDLRSTVTSVCEFLGIGWTDAMSEFAARAGTRGIATPSAAQVARGLNRDGRGTWRRYAEQMAPVLPTLRPWVERFGYSNA